MASAASEKPAAKRHQYVVSGWEKSGSLADPGVNAWAREKSRWFINHPGSPSFPRSGRAQRLFLLRANFPRARFGERARPVILRSHRFFHSHVEPAIEAHGARDPPGVCVVGSLLTQRRLLGNHSEIGKERLFPGDLKCRGARSHPADGVQFLARVW